MNISVKIFSALALILCTTVFFAGCTSNSGTANTTATTTATPSTITAAGALYTAGDIVKSPSGSATSAWLVISYDPATDSYTRAFVYQNPDGTWGYRVNSNTETAARNVMEKVYTVKVTHVSVPSVPVKTPTAVSTVAKATVTTGSGSVTTSATTTTTTTTPTGPPHFSSMTPDSADAGTTVSITDLVGSNFQSGASVMLAHTGSSNISATNVQVVSASHMTCTFVIPATASTGSWDIIITNPDGQSVTYTNYFMIHASTGVTATTTASTSSLNTISISAVSQPQITTGGLQTPTTQIRIYASNLQIIPTVVLQRSGYSNISASSVYMDSMSSVIVTFTIPAASQGYWDIVITNPDSSYGISSNAIQVT